MKNQHRWHFGTIGPLGGPDRTSMQTECLIEGSRRTVVEIRIPFLQDEIERELSFPERRFGEPWEIHPFSFSELEGEVELKTLYHGFPALFAAGMSLVDTTDNVLMLGAY